MREGRNGSGGPYPAAEFAGFAVQMVDRGPKRRARSIVARAVGRGWDIRRFGDRGTDFEVTDRGKTYSPAEAWEAAYRLRAQPGVAYAEPVFTVSLVDAPAYDGAPRAAAGAPRSAMEGLCTEPQPLPESGDVEWSVKAVRAPEAWQRFFPGQASPGAGITIGHPDTGYRRHPEITGNLLIERGFDFVDGDRDAEDELEEGVLLNPGHGTGTASVIVSPKGAPAAGASGAVTGMVPGAKLIPVRTARSVVVLLNTFDLARSIEHAVDQGAHVVSMSMGGVFSWRLRRAVGYAQKRGAIVLAAAGNCVGFVVWPAAYAEVVAVAASNARGGIWRGSSRGGAVDVTAPGESVWHAVVARDGTPRGAARSSGTSFAVATVAGAAALWLARHGREALIQRYGAEKIPAVFSRVLHQSCDAVPAWEPGQFGAGLLNVERLLAAPLPAVVPPAALALRDHVALDDGGAATFAHLFEQSLRAGTPEGARRAGVERTDAVRTTLSRVLQTGPDDLAWELGEVGQELAFYCATDRRLYAALGAALAETAEAAGRPGAARAAAPSAAVDEARGALLSREVSPVLGARLRAASGRRDESLAGV